VSAEFGGAGVEPAEVWTIRILKNFEQKTFNRPLSADRQKVVTKQETKQKNGQLD